VISVDAERSPRLVWISEATNELTLQDLVDGLRDWEDDPAGGMVYPSIVKAAGKESLGGGVTVGITATLQDAQVAFEPPTTTVSDGSATSASADGKTLIDSAATFVTDGVIAGANVVNSTTGAFGTVISVDSETQLTLRQLNGGSRQDWQTSDAYYVHNVIQKNISGGNLVAIDSVGAELDPIFVTAFTQVIRTSSSSATILNQTALETSLFGGIVYVDPVGGTAGTVFPVGTVETPALTLSDAKTIASTRGITHIKFTDDYTFASSDVLDALTISGTSSNAVTFTLTAGVSTENTIFQDASMNGTCGGYTIMQRCEIYDVSNYHGWMHACIHRIGTLTLSGDSNKLALLLSPYSGVVTGEPQPWIDFNGAGAGLIIRAYSGPIRLKNKTGGAGICLDFISGKLILDSTITYGHFPIRGTVFVVDNKSGTATVEEEAIGTSEEARDIHKIMGLDPAYPATITRYTQTAGAIQVGITGNGDSQTILTRQ